MPDDGLQEIAKRFDGMVRDDLIAAYCKLLDAGIVPKAEAEGFLGGPDTVRELTELGLAHVVSFPPSSGHLT